MRRSAASALVVVLVLWISSPALACLTRPEKMTEAEMQCCREMAGRCDEMGGEIAKAEHSCCPKTPAKVETAKKIVLATSEAYVSVTPLVVVAHSVTLPLASVSVESVPTNRVHARESPPGALTPLRI